jgi:hypothetical protein
MGFDSRIERRKRIVELAAPIADGWDGVLKPVVARYQIRAPRSSGHGSRFAPNAVRHQLHALAYNLWQLSGHACNTEAIKD